MGSPKPGVTTSETLNSVKEKGSKTTPTCGKLHITAGQEEIPSGRLKPKRRSKDFQETITGSDVSVKEQFPCPRQKLETRHLMYFKGWLESPKETEL